MKRILFASLLMLSLSFLALGQTPDTKMESKTRDEAAIRKLMEDLAVAWNKHDGVSFAMLFAAMKARVPNAIRVPTFVFNLAKFGVTERYFQARH
jgi:hypothetical protein